MKTTELNGEMYKLRNNGLKIKEGDKITFDYYGTVYTRKVQTMHISFNGLTNYNVNNIGSGTGWTGVDAEDVIKINKKK
tara:strand:- start:301 stop:537 length:237 start_codon:yes stop_codon:yes gene_type:complete